jgi:N6-L-threonylcarbamoyladenine synthase
MKSPAKILAIESTCDETGAAIVESGTRVLSNIVASQVDLHARYRGVVPEIASRAHIENILPVISEATQTAGIDLTEIDAIAVAHRPGLIGSLLIGVTAAKTLAWFLNKPLIGVDHVHAHLYSVCLGDPQCFSRVARDARPPLSPSPCTQGEGRGEGSSHPNVRPQNIPMPSIGLVCSGGHTALYHLQNFLDVKLIGSAIDDAVGEAYDKVAGILGLGYPGGPILDSLAAHGNPKAINFPRSRLSRHSLDFSFSGLKTSVLYHVRGFQGRERDATKLSESELRDIAASFQAACVDILVEKIHRAADQTGAKSVIIGGGVSANRGLREALSNFPIPVFFPPMRYCTDNAAMTAGLAHVLLEAGKTNELDLDAIPFSQLSAQD